jgi:hypothetical protein
METLWNNKEELRDDFPAPDEENDWDAGGEEQDDGYVKSNEDDEDDLIPIADDDDNDGTSGERDDDHDGDDLDPLADRPTTFEADGDFTPNRHGRTTGTMIDHEPGLPGPAGGRQ